MRDPKTHAKVLALRAAGLSQDTWRAALHEQMDRVVRLSRLAVRVEDAAAAWAASTKWTYDADSVPPRWVYTEIDIEEEA